MTHYFIFSSFFAIFEKSSNLFLILLSLEVSVLGLLIFIATSKPLVVLLMVFIFIMSSISGLIIFMSVVKKFMSSMSMSYLY